MVEDTFAITKRGVVVAPEVDLGDGRRTITVELRRPDGAVVRAEACAEIPFTNPPRLEARHVLRFATLSKADVPNGTEIWIDDGTPET